MQFTVQTNKTKEGLVQWLKLAKGWCKTNSGAMESPTNSGGPILVDGKDVVGRAKNLGQRGQYFKTFLHKNISTFINYAQKLANGYP